MKKVFAVGDLNIDLFTLASGGHIFGEEHVAKKFYYSLGGNAANFSAAIASLGVEVHLVSAIGKDVFSGFLLGELNAHKVKPRLDEYGSANGISNIFVSESGERAIISNKGCLMNIGCSGIAKKIIPMLAAGDIVLFGGYFHLPKMHMGFPALLKSIRKKKALVFFDACFDEYGKWQVKNFLKFVDVLFLNEVELEKISGTKGKESGVKKLFSLGANTVVLKKGPLGAEYFQLNANERGEKRPVSYGKIERVALPAISGKAINATGAGDFFNAGFAYGYLRGFSAKNCLLCGNYVAGKKITRKGYFCPSGKSINGFLKKQNLIDVRKVKNYHALSRAAANIIVKQLQEKPGSVLCLAAGRTPAETYAELVRRCKKGDVDFSRTSFIEIDEYLGLRRSKDGFAHFLDKNLLSKSNFRRKNIFLFNQKSIGHKAMQAECKKFDSLVRRKGIDLLLLGIGENCHIAYNEPGTSFFSKTHVVKLSHGLLRQRNKIFLGGAPSHAITLGLRVIMSAKKIVLIASGNKKARAVKLALKSRPGPMAPASCLQRHGNATFIVDSRAGKFI